MCSQFQLQKAMENTNYQGDLADIFRGSGSSGGTVNTTTTTTKMTVTSGGESSSAAVTTDGWQGFPSHPIDYSRSVIEEPSIQDFGDPFCNLRDPLFHDLDMMQASSSLFSSNEDNNNNNNNSSENNSSFFEPKVLGEEMKRRANNTGNIFSRMLQISPTTKLAMSPCNSPMATAANVALMNPPSNIIAGGGGGGGALLLANDTIISPNSSSKTCLVDQNSGLQISSPRNTGIKRRKSQAKKVVCIPAAAPVNSRQGGEVVPSDLWAWRKYGQKPIKGSPYPRGYYRCSSSKGCSARKQVERSRTDPNMLVITYTSEHNHPWPTQRNALAGSTRSQPNSKNTSTPKNNTITQKSPINTSVKEDEQKDSNIIVDNNNNNASNVAQVNVPTCPKLVKEEMADQEDHINHHHHQLIEMHDVEFSQGIQDTYQPTLPDSSSNHSHEDFFADLVELEADPLNLLFTKTLSGDIEQGRHKKSIDSFNLYEWTSGDNSKDNNNNNKGQIDP